MLTAFALGAAAGGAVISGKSPRAEAAMVFEAPAPLIPTPVASGPRYPADVIRVIDGDTFEARVRIWPGLETSTKVRLRGIDAPELNGACRSERDLADAARSALVAMLTPGEVDISAVSLDKYGGRVVASASSRGAPDIGQALLAAGFARPYRGRRESWC